MTEFLWALAVIGAILLAVGLGRVAGGDDTSGDDGSGSAVAYESDETAYDRDNRQRFNMGALLVFVVIIGGIVALAVGLSLD